MVVSNIQTAETNINILIHELWIQISGKEFLCHELHVNHVTDPALINTNY